MISPKKPDATGTAECPNCGTASSTRELLIVPDALRLLRAYGQLDPGDMRQVVIDLVENIVAQRNQVQ
jgi:hypothetical protein